MSFLPILAVAALAAQQPEPPKTPASSPSSKLICYGIITRIGVARDASTETRRVLCSPYDYVRVHLANGTGKQVATGFTPYFESELRDSQGNVVPLTQKYLARAAAAPRAAGGRLLGPGETAFYDYDLDSRYGRLAPGHYSLAVRHPHPTSGATLTCNAITFQVK